MNAGDFDLCLVGLGRVKRDAVCLLVRDLDQARVAEVVIQVRHRQKSLEIRVNQSLLLQVEGLIIGIKICLTINSSNYRG